ncbi:MAG: Rv3654c family TadE-like protein [Microbacteriaceae bacterium]
MRREREVDGQSGSGSVLVVAIIAGMLCLVAMVLPLQLALARGQGVIGAADASALAAADVRSGAVGGVPCVVAASVAESNGATMLSCSLDGLVATVVVVGSFAGLPLRGAATAGPPPTSPERGG